MEGANILQSLKQVCMKGSLENLILYGKVRCGIKRPNILGKSLQVSPVGTFAILDVFAVKCLKTDYFGGTSASGVYYSRGSMVIFIDSLSWVGEIVKVAGNNLRNGVKVRQQYNHSTPYDGITALAFQMVGKDFIIAPNYIEKLGNRESDFRTTPLEDFVIKLRSSDIMEFPVTLDSIIDYEGLEEYEEVDANEVVDKSSTYSDDGKIDVSQIKMNLEYHLEGKEISDLLEPIKDDIKEMSKNRKNYAKELYKGILKSIKNDPNDDDLLDAIRDAFIDEVLTRYSNTIGESNVKGRVYAEEFVSGMQRKPIGYSDEGSEKKFPSKEELSKSAELLRSLIQMNPEMLKDPLPSDVNLPSLRDKIQVALTIISISTGIDFGSFESNFYSCNRMCQITLTEWFHTLLYTPYVLGILGSSMNVVSCDRVYFSYTRFFTNNCHAKECGEIRNDLMYLKTLEDADDTDLFIKISDLSRMEASYPENGKRFLSTNNFPARKDLVELLSVICGTKIAMSDKMLENLKNMRWYSEERTEKLVSRGIVNTIDDSYVALERDIEKEVLIYETLIKKGLQETGISEEDVEDTIEEFESEEGLTLEPLQRDGIKLCMHSAAVLSGCAGSGKTTTSNCIKMCIENCMNGYTLIYGTPTGKACRRLAEVVGGTVRTLHSQFQVGLFGEGYLSNISKQYSGNGEPTRNVYILDEMAMCDSDLLYNVCRNLSSLDCVYFLGDCKQLKPIGRGIPFYILMKILPCVELGTSKRAAEGSEVNYNVMLINNASDGVVQELYYDEKTFFCRDCADAEIPTTVIKFWSEMLQNYNEDDIQVISGYASPEKTFSSTTLNPMLQKMLRKGDKLLFRHGDSEFYMKDRVIHTQLNMYGAQRYVEVGENTFKAIVTLGIMNGEIGKIEGIVRSDMCNIIDFDSSDLEDEEQLYGHLSKDMKKTLLNNRERLEDQIRYESELSHSQFYFVKVRVYDSDLKRDVFVLYTGGSHVQEDGIMSLSGEEIGALDLAYALTTHKMQGSQSPVVICVYGTTCNPQFINRNMINTMVSRSQEIVCMVGDVRGIDSAVTKGRKCVSSLDTNDMLTMLSK